VWIGSQFEHPRSLGSTLGNTGADGTHRAGLTTTGGRKGLQAVVLNGGEGVPVGGDNSEELLWVGKWEGSERSRSHHSLGEEDSEMMALTDEMGQQRRGDQIPAWQDDGRGKMGVSDVALGMRRE
jgi:hypothetical protein